MIRPFAFWFLSLACSFGAVEMSGPIVLSPAEGLREGAELVARMRSMEPEKSSTSTGYLTIKLPKTAPITVPIRFEVKLAENGWQTIYEAPGFTNGISQLAVHHTASGTNSYSVWEQGLKKSLTADQTFVPFAGSDFWAVDLGLEFLAWPAQRVLRKEIRRNQSCAVLESTNPNPKPGTYTRVLSWVDIDTGGIVNAEAYGTGRKSVKDFAASSFKKVQGNWELKEVEMYNRNTGSRTTLTFDLDRK